MGCQCNSLCECQQADPAVAELEERVERLESLMTTLGDAFQELLLTHAKSQDKAADFIKLLMESNERLQQHVKGLSSQLPGSDDADPTGRVN